MNGRFVVALLAAGLAAAACKQAPAPAPTTTPAVPAAAGDGPRGTIKGRVRLTGTPPKNPVIFMRNDPMCPPSSAGTVVQETIVARPDGRLANVFVRLDGSFPETVVPTEPVRIDQRGCLYTPRVVGIRVGQSLRVSNSDEGLHNVHGISAGSDGFNVAQPLVGMANQFTLKTEGVLRIMCDVHPWMIAFAGVVNHPYFAVTGADGTFEIRDVPAGEQTMQAWHERLGMLTSKVRVDPGGVAEAEFVYPAAAHEKP